MTQRALILFGHGARDARWAEPFVRLQTLLRGLMPNVSVELAFLELMTPSLPEIVARLVQDGCDSINVVPVFFGQGGHVLRDLPLLAERLRLEYPALDLQLAKAVGEDEGVLRSIAAYCVSTLHAE